MRLPMPEALILFGNCFSIVIFTGGGGGGGGVMVETCYRSKFYSLFVTLAYFDSQNKDWTF